MVQIFTVQFLPKSKGDQMWEAGRTWEAGWQILDDEAGRKTVIATARKCLIKAGINRNDPILEDLVQDTLISFGIIRIKADLNWASLVCKIATWKAMDYYRRNGNRKIVFLDELEALIFDSELDGVDGLDSKEGMVFNLWWQSLTTLERHVYEKKSRKVESNTVASDLGLSVNEVEKIRLRYLELLKVAVAEIYFQKDLDELDVGVKVKIETWNCQSVEDMAIHDVFDVAVE